MLGIEFRNLSSFLPFILLSDWKRLNCIKACHKNWANIILPSLYVFDRLYDIMLSQGYNYSSINVATQFQLNCISFSMYVDTKRIYVYQKCKFCCPLRKSINTLIHLFFSYTLAWISCRQLSTLEIHLVCLKYLSDSRVNISRYDVALRDTFLIGKANFRLYPALG